MQTRQWKREKESKIVEAARATLYHRLLMREQKTRLERLLDDDALPNLDSFMALAADVDVPTEALMISSNTIREALGLSQKAAPKSANEDG